MIRSSIIRIASIGIVAAGLLGLGASGAHAARPAADTASNRGSVTITFDPDVVEQMFKVGAFIYGSSEVSAYLSDSGSLSGSFPLTGSARARQSTLITVDPEVGGLTIYNGPAGTRAGLTSIVVKRTGSTGVVNAKIVGMFSPTDGQFSKNLTAFTITKAQTKKTSRGWQMDGTLTMTADAASTLNTLLKATVFTAGSPIGTLEATVGASVRP